MKVNYWKAIKVNNELKLNVDQQQEDIKHSKELCDIDNEDEVQEISADITIMKKKKPVSVTCNEIFGTKNWLKKHIKEEHIELW